MRVATTRASVASSGSAVNRNRYEKLAFWPAAIGVFGCQYATMLSWISRSEGISTSSTWPLPHWPFGSTQSDGRLL